MSFFGRSNTEKLWSQIEPRKVFLFAWVAMCALAFIFVIKSGGFGVRENPPAPAATVKSLSVLVAKENIMQGKRLESSMFTIETRPVPGLEDKITTDLSQIEGGYAATPIFSGVPLLKENISMTVVGNPITLNIPDGFRAVTVSVDAESGVEGWVRPGVSVDVVWSSDYRGKATVNTIVENAKVLSAERTTVSNIAEDSTKPIPSHVTLLVSSDDAMKIHLAKKSGIVSLTLRGDEDVQKAGSETITIDRLLKTTRAGTEEEITGWVSVGEKSFNVTTSGKIYSSKEAEVRAESAKKTLLSKGRDHDE